MTGDTKLYNEKKSAEILAYAERHEALKVHLALPVLPTSGASRYARWIVRVLLPAPRRVCIVSQP